MWSKIAPAEANDSQNSNPRYQAYAENLAKTCSTESLAHKHARRILVQDLKMPVSCPVWGE